MSQVLEQADELRKQAIAILLAERQAIDERLALLGYDGTPPIPKSRACGACGSEGHTARTCTNKKVAPTPPPAEFTTSH